MDRGCRCQDRYVERGSPWQNGYIESFNAWWAREDSTSNQTVMSGPVSPESSDKFDVFRCVRTRSFASVHGVSVVYLWSVRKQVYRALAKGP